MSGPPQTNGESRYGSWETPISPPWRFLPWSGCAALWPHAMLDCRPPGGRDLAGGSPSLWQAHHRDVETGWLTPCPSPGTERSGFFPEKRRPTLLGRHQALPWQTPSLLGGLGKKRRFISKEIRRSAFLMGWEPPSRRYPHCPPASDERDRRMADISFHVFSFSFLLPSLIFNQLKCALYLFY